MVVGMFPCFISCKVRCYLFGGPLAADQFTEDATGTMECDSDGIVVRSSLLILHGQSLESMA